jgi:small basic protein (TIGR04137 family)
MRHSRIKYLPNFVIAEPFFPATLTVHFLNRKKFMSQHRSLRAASTLGGKRNVLKRFERVEILKKRGQWKDGDRITNLRKTKADA